ncbi:P-loop containing nucleoside triphosphate hydrolase protein [Obelidium mucronatum]|nr:P-loop containing nucleoside triphosphate hydrolase protein [Obelidium mucronatum]
MLFLSISLVSLFAPLSFLSFFLFFLHEMTVTFASIGASVRIAGNLASQFGAVTPTSMQTALFPALLSHRDVVLKDATGTGKSLGLLAALLSKKTPLVVDARSGRKTRYTGAVLVAPTAELALQLHGWARALLGGGVAAADVAKHVQVLVPAAGDADRAAQHALAAALRPALLIGTPRRLLDAVAAGACDVARLQTLVLDEADALVRVPTRFETNKEKLNRLNHPLYAELLVDHILKVRRPESVGGSVGKKKLQLHQHQQQQQQHQQQHQHQHHQQRETLAPLPASINRAQQYTSTILETRVRSNPAAVVDAAAARRLQVVICSATMNNPVRKELERMRGWIVDPILMDVNGTHSAPSSIEHTCLVVSRDGTSVRNMYSKAEQDKLHAEAISSRNATADRSKNNKEPDPVWVEKMKYPALEDDDPRMIKIVASLCKKESVHRGILFLNSNISCARVVDQLKKLGIKAARISEDVDYQAAISNYMSHTPPTSNADSLDATTDSIEDTGIESPVTAPITTSTNPTTTPVIKSSLFFQSNQELMVISEHNARGLDLPDVSHVFLVGPPSSPASYLHMSGRVGRFGKAGKCILVLGGERYERKMADVFNLLSITPSEYKSI